MELISSIALGIVLGLSLWHVAIPFFGQMLKNFINDFIDLMKFLLRISLVMSFVKYVLFMVDCVMGGIGIMLLYEQGHFYFTGKVTPELENTQRLYSNLSSLQIFMSFTFFCVYVWLKGFVDECERENYFLSKEKKTDSDDRSDEEKRSDRNATIFAWTIIILLLFFFYCICAEWYSIIGLVGLLIIVLIVAPIIGPILLSKGRDDLTQQNELVIENGRIMKCDTCGSDAFFKIETGYACRRHEIYERYRKQ